MAGTGTRPRAQPRRVGLPASIRACLFDLDGVLTQTAELHAAAWKAMFDEYLRARSARSGDPFVEFDSARDYLQFVDGRPRADGVRSFLASRGIAAGQETASELGDRKNELVLAILRRAGVAAFPDAVAYLAAARTAALRCAVVSASANCAEVLEAVRLADAFDVRVDGDVAARDGLRGKPAPDTFLAGARALGIAPQEAAVFEDALAGVEAGRAGGFGYVVGVDRNAHGAALLEHGADVVVTTLDELLERR